MKTVSVKLPDSIDEKEIAVEISTFLARNGHKPLLAGIKSTDKGIEQAISIREDINCAVLF
jgi:hypothetical protein